MTNSDKALKFLGSRMNRRRAISTAGKIAIGAGVVVVAGAGATTYFLSQPPTSTTIEKPDTVVIAFNSVVPNMDPHALNASAVEQSPFMAIFDPFIQQDRNLNWKPGVVSEWKWSSDKLNLNLKIQKDVKFHNGDALTAEDVAFSLERLASPEMPYGYGIFNAQKPEVLDDYSVRCVFGDIYPGWEVWLGFLDSLVLPKKYYEEVGLDGFLAHPVGSGPYKLKKFVLDSVIELEAFDDYWQGPAPVKNIIFKIVQNASSRTAEIESGSSDITSETSISDYERLSQMPNLKGVKQLITDTAYLVLAPMYNEEIADLDIRLAMHYAIDKKELTEKVMQGFGNPLSTLEAPGYAAYIDDYHFPYDPEKAKNLLAKSGYSTEKPLKITAGGYSGWRTRDLEFMQAIVGMWKKVGIEADFKYYSDVVDFFAKMDAGQLYAASLYYWANSSGEFWNTTGYATWPESPFSPWLAVADKITNPDMLQLRDNLNEKLGNIWVETDDAKRRQLEKEAVVYVVEQGMVIPLFQPASPIIMKKELQYDPFPQGWTIPQAMSWG